MQVKPTIKGNIPVFGRIGCNLKLEPFSGTIGPSPPSKDGEEDGLTDFVVGQ